LPRQAARGQGRRERSRPPAAPETSAVLEPIPAPSRAGCRPPRRLRPKKSPAGAGLLARDNRTVHASGSEAAVIWQPNGRLSFTCINSPTRLVAIAGAPAPGTVGIARTRDRRTCPDDARVPPGGLASRPGRRRPQSGRPALRRPSIIRCRRPSS
jgi:hypothetical protein